MKKTLFILLAAAALSSCENATFEMASEALEPVRFAAGIPSAKVSLDCEEMHFAWDESDIVGIYASADGKVTGQNYPYRVLISEDGGPTRLQASSSAYHFYWKDVQKYTFNAYYPFTGVPESGNDYAVPAEIKTLQRQRCAGDCSNVGKYLLMKATEVSTDKDGLVSLRFRSLVSIVELRLKLSGTASSKPINTVTMYAENGLSAPTAHILVNTDEGFSKDMDPLVLNQTVDSVEVVLDEECRIDASHTESVYLVLAPGNHDAGTIRVNVVTSDGYECCVTVSDPVCFEANGYYVRTLEFPNNDFHESGRPVVGPTSRYKAVTALADLKIGKVIPTYYVPALERHCLLTCAPIARSATATSLEEIGATFDSGGNITKMPQEGFEWDLGKEGDYYTFKYTEGGTTYQLIGCDQTQGAAISTNLTGYKTYTGYQNTWKALENDLGIQMVTTANEARYLYPYYDPDGAVPILVPTWRLAKVLQGGYFVFYYYEEIE